MTEYHLERKSIPEDLREPLRQFAVGLKRGGDNVLSWVLHGPVVAGTFDRERHAIHSVLVVRTIDWNRLRNLADDSHNHRDARLAVPLVMTPDFLKASQDTFPLELLEIQQQYHVVFGEDYFGPLVFNPQHVRMQCERELKVLAISLRQGLLAAAGKKRRLAALQQDWADALLRILRGMLWLKGQKEGLPAEQTLSKVEAAIGHRLSGIREAMAAGNAVSWEMHHNLYADAETLGNAVNEW